MTSWTHGLSTNCPHLWEICCPHRLLPPGGPFPQNAAISQPEIPSPESHGLDDEGDRFGSGISGMSRTLTRVSTEAKKARMDKSLAKPSSEELNERSLAASLAPSLHVQRHANLPALLRVEPSWTMYKALWLTMWVFFPGLAVYRLFRLCGSLTPPVLQLGHSRFCLK